MKDVIIIGGGPAGVTAAIYLKRAGLDICIFEKMFIGGQISITSEIENYPGFGEPISGADFAVELYNQCNNMKIEIKNEEILSVDLHKKTVSTAKETFEAKAIVIATGAMVKKLGIMAEDKFSGRGVSYCATCDGSFYKGKNVAVVGGGNTALEEALYLSNIAKTVYIVHRRDEFRATSIMQDRVKTKDNIIIKYNSIIKDLEGTQKLEAMILDQGGIENKVVVDGVFIAIGRSPETNIFEQIEKDNQGYIIVDEDMKTNIDGVFAAGDVCHKKLRQVVTATNDGAIAANSISEYLQ